MTVLRNQDIQEPVRNAEVDPANMAKPGRHRLACRWEKAVDGALVMVWSVAEAKLPALRVVSSNPNPAAPDRVARNELAKPSRPMNGMRSAAERAAIALLLGASGFLTWMSFIVEHNDLL
jgi:hypothetical protein